MLFMITAIQRNVKIILLLTVHIYFEREEGLWWHQMHVIRKWDWPKWCLTRETYLCCRNLCNKLGKIKRENMQMQINFYFLCSKSFNAFPFWKSEKTEYFPQGDSNPKKIWLTQIKKLLVMPLDAFSIATWFLYKYT